MAEQIEAACGVIAPTWPLESFIAVNPYWGWREQPVQRAAAALGLLAGTRLTAPRRVFRDARAAGRLQPADLQAALDAAGGGDADALTAALDAAESEAPPQRLPLVTDLCDALGSPWPGQTWSALVTHQISQHCAAVFDRGLAGWRPTPVGGLWGSWLHALPGDRGLPWPAGRAAMLERLRSLPADPVAAIERLLTHLKVPQEARAPYLQAVLMSMHGWAAWGAQLRWQAQLQRQPVAAENDALVHLLAVRLCWEGLLADDAHALPAWRQRWAAVAEEQEALQQRQAADWLLQSALEFGHQRHITAGLQRAVPPPSAVSAATSLQPLVQAVFCIDVRSEPMRRALEFAAGGALQTRGFAGFFGLPIAYRAAGAACSRPQLPGLLSPTLVVTDEAVSTGQPAHASDGRSLQSVLAEQRSAGFGLARLWRDFKQAPASIFSMVEAMGLSYGAKLLSDSLPSAATPATERASPLRPRLPWAATQADTDAAVDLAAGILRAMGLVGGFAPIVLLVGHGSRSANNPQAAGLDCGACGGQTGEVNARVLADLLNRPAVRAGLADRGIHLPPTSHAVAALHDTATDDIRLYDADTVPPALQGELTRLRGWLAEAANLARAARAVSLGLGGKLSGSHSPEKLATALRRRARDWSQVRPEWGLADNAALIVAPRARTAGMDLNGRSFLHDYDWRLDPDRSVLTLIMTAPMVVTNWINLQYHASTLDNRRYGSGNKVLHNVVGDGVGVFEGNGGDLRTGLAMQSLHDGLRWRHTPLRLSVFIEAPREAIEAVMAQQEVVRQLVDNGWLHLLRIDSARWDAQMAPPVVERWTPVHRRWLPA